MLCWFLTFPVVCSFALFYDFISFDYFCFLPIQCEIPDGGIIPKSFYRSAEEIYSPDELPLCSETVYKLSILQKGVPHEVSSPQQYCLGHYARCLQDKTHLDAHC